MPSWQYAAGQMEVMLVMDGVEDAHAGRLNLTIKETLSSYEPHSGLVYGSYIRLNGLGFIAEVWRLWPSMPPHMHAKTYQGVCFRPNIKTYIYRRVNTHLQPKTPIRVHHA